MSHQNLWCHCHGWKGLHKMSLILTLGFHQHFQDWPLSCASTLGTDEKNSSVHVQSINWKRLGNQCRNWSRCTIAQSMTMSEDSLCSSSHSCRQQQLSHCPFVLLGCSNPNCGFHEPPLQRIYFEDRSLMLIYNLFHPIETDED